MEKRKYCLDAKQTVAIRYLVNREIIKHLKRAPQNEDQISTYRGILEALSKPEQTPGYGTNDYTDPTKIQEDLAKLKERGAVAFSTTTMPMHVTPEARNALAVVVKAIEVNDGDTISSQRKDNSLICTFSGSWSSPINLRLGHLRAIARYAKDQFGL